MYLHAYVCSTIEQFSEPNVFCMQLKLSCTANVQANEYSAHTDAQRI